MRATKEEEVKRGDKIDANKNGSSKEVKKESCPKTHIQLNY